MMYDYASRARYDARDRQADFQLMVRACVLAIRASVENRDFFLLPFIYLFSATVNEHP